MPKKAGIAIVTLGAVLILSALLLFLYNRHQDTLAGREAESLLSDVESLIENRATEPPAEIETEINPTGQTEEPTIAPELPVVMVNGYEYVGYLEIPLLERKLPVMAEWDYDKLEISPCRQLGSSRTDDLVIAAHNYSTHFGRLKELSEGDTVVFTDMDGIVNTYSVEKIEDLDPYDVDTVLNSDYDLVLYTCTVGAKARVTVFCDRITEETDISGTQDGETGKDA